MPKVLTLKDEIILAIAFLKENNMPRAANLFEHAPAVRKALTPPTKKETKPKPRPVRVRGGSGRTFPSKLAYSDKDVTE